MRNLISTIDKCKEGVELIGNIGITSQHDNIVVDMKNSNFRKDTDLSFLFNNADKDSFDLSSFNTSEVKDLSKLFENSNLVYNYFDE